MLDLKLAARRLIKSRGFTVTALATLALCIGANLTIFAVVDSIVLRPLPFDDPNQLVVVFNSYPLSGEDRGTSSPADYYAYRDSIQAFSTVAVIATRGAVVDQSGVPIRVERAVVSPEFFDTLGVSMSMGRAFTEEEMEVARSNVAVLSHEYWQNQFNGNADVLGRSFHVDGTPTTVVGVLPEGFRYLSNRPRFFTPAVSDPAQRGTASRHRDNWLEMIARLAPGETPTSAQSEIKALNNVQLMNEHPAAEHLKAVGYFARVESLHAEHVKAVRPTLLLLQGGVLFLLLLGAINLVNLLLIRASGRAKDLAVRQALGASPRHIVSLVASEILLLSVLGGLLGLGAAAGGIRLLTVFGVEQLPMGAHIAFDVRLAMVAIVGAIGLGILMSLPIAWFNLKLRLASTLQSEARGGTAGRAAQRMRQAFIVVQIAIAFTLLASGGLLGVSLKRVLETSPGFRPEHVVSGRFVLPANRNLNATESLAFAERIIRALDRLPEVDFAAINSDTPFTRGDSHAVVTVEGYIGDLNHVHKRHAIAGDYWQAMGIPLIEGRALQHVDNHRDRRVCVVDQVFARRYWPGESAVGRRLCDGLFEESEAFTIVGVVGTVKQNDLSETKPLGTVYFPYRMWARRGFDLIVRTGVAPDAFAPTFRETVQQVVPEVPLDDLKPMQLRIDDSVTIRRSPALLLGITSGIALLLAAIGTYGVLAYAVTQRRREIGVCIALGATREQIGYQFFGMGLRLLAVGTLAGVVGASLAGQTLKSILFEVPALHVPTILATFGVMSGVTLLACLMPSLRASRVDPMAALRSE